MTAQIKSLVSTALNAAHAYGDAIAKLRTALSGQVSTDVREALLPYVAAYYRVALVAKERGEGVTLDKEAQKYDACVKAIQRMTKDIVGGTAERTVAEEVKLTKAQRAAIRACMDLGITMKLYGQGVAILK